MDPGDDADKEVEADAVSDVQIAVERLRANARDAGLSIGLVGEDVVHVIGQLAMNAHRLHSLQHGVSRAFQHL